MPGTHMRFSDEQREVKQKAGATWEEVIALGIKVLDTGMQKEVEAEYDTQQEVAK